MLHLSHPSAEAKQLAADTADDLEALAKLVDQNREDAADARAELKEDAKFIMGKLWDDVSLAACRVACLSSLTDSRFEESWDFMIFKCMRGCGSGKNVMEASMYFILFSITYFFLFHAIQFFLSFFFFFLCVCVGVCKK